MGLSNFERKLERGVEGVFGRVFRSEVRPVEIGRKLVREMDVARTVGVNGQTLVPNSYLVVVSPSDHEQFADMVDPLSGELMALLKQHAKDERYRFVGPLAVSFEVDEQQRPGVVGIDSRFRQPNAGDVMAHLLLPGGQRVPLSVEAVSVGRSPDCTVQLGDQNASRRHAEIRPVEGGYAVVDLASTNGTLVNGRRVAEHILNDGDDITFGQTTIRYERA
ncbi:MAG: FHA domain-containing protein [Microthrixaceae bacterium]|nr:FHA domain-containing protein [Microthrixaceae bacterium]MCO5311453.1 FHA domain-containing protein [Microthrixaceae bacterium]HPB45797.1 DUF3662 and FHA domain-containing protein [Microthrixaceae bacterium]